MRRQRDGYQRPFLSGLLSLLVAPPVRWEGLIWVALVPLFVWLLEPHRTVRQALLGTGAVGLVYYVGISWPFLSLAWWGWGSASDAEYVLFLITQKVFMGLVIVLLSCWGGLLWGVCGWLTVRYARTLPRAVWLIPCLWVVVVEFLGHWVIGGMSWGWLGYHLHDVAVLSQLASLTGVVGLSFLILLVNAALASWGQLWRARQRTTRAPRNVGAIVAQAATALAYPSARMLVVVPCLTLLAASAYGLLRLPVIDGQTGDRLQVATLQANRSDQDLPEAMAIALDQTYGPLLDEAVTGQADLIVLPETIWFRMLQLDTTAPRLSSGALPVSRQELAGVWARRLAGSPTMLIHGIDTAIRGEVYNAMAFWSANGLEGTYFKRALVPFAEFRPRGLGWLAPQNQLHGSGFGYAPGHGTQLVTVRGVTIGGLICQEIMFPELMRQSVGQGAQVLISTGHDGVFTSPWVSQAFADMAVFRAVETNRFLVRSMKTGISAILDPSGQRLAEAPANAEAVLRQPILALDARTLHVRWGAWIVWASGAVLAWLLAPAPRVLLSATAARGLAT